MKADAVQDFSRMTKRRISERGLVKMGADFCPLLFSSIRHKLKDTPDEVALFAPSQRKQYKANLERTLEFTFDNTHVLRFNASQKCEMAREEIGDH